MFDSRPGNAQPSPRSGGSFVRAASQPRRRSYAVYGTAVGETPDDTIQLIADWSDTPDALREAVECASDWGPFELCELIPVTTEALGGQRIFCRFIYHGPEASRSHYEANLRAMLTELAAWQDVEPVKPAT